MNASSPKANIMAVTQAISRISDFEPKSFYLKEFIENMKILISDYQHNITDGIQEWLMVYDKQANLFVQGTLITTVCNPNALPPDEVECFKEEFCVIKEFIVTLRTSLK